MSKLPRTQVIENQIAVVADEHNIDAAELVAVQGAIGLAPMYGAPRPPSPQVSLEDVWKRILAGVTNVTKQLPGTKIRPPVPVPHPLPRIPH